MGRPRPLFHFFISSFRKHIIIFTANKCENVHPVYGLWNMSITITTKPGLPPKIRLLYLSTSYVSTTNSIERLNGLMPVRRSAWFTFNSEGRGSITTRFFRFLWPISDSNYDQKVILYQHTLLYR